MLTEIKVEAELRREFGHPGSFLKIDVYPRTNDNQPISYNYPVEFKIMDDNLISDFERTFDMVKMSFLEHIRNIQQDEKFRAEFKKNPEGYIARALSVGGNKR